LFEVAGEIVNGITNQARYADIVILGKYEWHGSDRIEVLHPYRAFLVLMFGPEPIAAQLFDAR
jgi:hypothetical protein